MTFEEWWTAFNEAVNREVLWYLFSDSPELYKNYYDTNISPEDAVKIELNNFKSLSVNGRKVT